MSGAIVIEHGRVFIERFGDEVLNEVVSALPGEIARELDEATPTSWIPLSTVEILYDAMATRLGRDVGDLHMEIGRVAIERTLRTLGSFVLRLTSDRAIMTRSPLLFSKSYDRGKLITDIPKPGYGEVVLSEWPGVGEFPLRGLCNGIAATLSIAGRRNVEVRVVERRSDGAVVAVTWEP